MKGDGHIYKLIPEKNGDEKNLLGKTLDQTWLSPSSFVCKSKPRVQGLEEEDDDDDSSSVNPHSGSEK